MAVISGEGKLQEKPNNCRALKVFNLPFRKGKREFREIKDKLKPWESPACKWKAWQPRH